MGVTSGGGNVCLVTTQGIRYLHITVLEEVTFSMLESWWAGGSTICHCSVGYQLILVPYCYYILSQEPL